MSQLLQADGMRLAQEAHRRNMPYCMGTLYWQHNDCWPVASWSTSDYYGNWKAAHYRTRKSYENVIVSTTRKDDRLEVYVVSDLMQSLEGEINLKLMNFKGTVLREHNESVEVAFNSSKKVLDLDYKDLMGANISSNVFACATFTSEGVKAESIYLFEKLKAIELPKADIKRTITSFDGGYAIKLSTDNFARGVYLSVEDEKPLFFSDNYFDMLPRSSRIVVVRTPMSKSDLESKLHVISMCDAVK